MFDKLIYGLVDPFSGQIRYIGLSTTGLKRPRTHLFPCNWKYGRSYKERWVRGLFKRGAAPIIKIIQQWKVISFEELCNAETYWIGYFRGLGCRLTNITDGGEGTIGYKFSTKSRLKMSLAKKGKSPSESARKNMALAQKGRKHSEETKSKIAASHKGLGHSDETKAKLSEINKGKKLSGDTKSKISSSLRGRKLSSEACANISKGRKGIGIGRKASKETKDKMSKARKGKKHSEATKAKMAVARKKWWRSK